MSLFDIQVILNSVRKQVESQSINGHTASQLVHFLLPEHTGLPEVRFTLLLIPYFFPVFIYFLIDANCYDLGVAATILHPMLRSNLHMLRFFKKNMFFPWILLKNSHFWHQQPHIRLFSWFRLKQTCRKSWFYWYFRKILLILLIRKI